MKKAHLVRQIVSSLTDSLGVLEKAARASHEEATHESSKAESKYDTRGLEAAYLAGGQARQAKEILDSIKVYETLAVKDFAPGEPIDLTALVELDTDGIRSTYFIGPKNGGLGNRTPAEGDHGDHAPIASGPKLNGQKSGPALDGQDWRFDRKISHRLGAVIGRGRAREFPHVTGSDGRLCTVPSGDYVSGSAGAPAPAARRRSPG